MGIRSNASFPASLGRRLAAYLLDVPIAVVISFVPSIITMRLLIASGTWAPASHDPREQWNTLGVFAKLAVMTAFFVSGGPVYFILCHASPWQATFGKRLLINPIINKKTLPIR